MSATEPNPPGGETGIPKAEHDAAVASARAEGHAADKAEGEALGMSAERERFKAILGSDAGKANLSVATALALTGSTAEQATAVLAVTPKAASGLGQLMATVPDADLGTGAVPQKPETNALAARMAKRFGGKN